MEEFTIELELPEAEGIKQEEEVVDTVNEETIDEKPIEEDEEEPIEKKTEEDSDVDILKAKYEIFKEYGAVRETDNITEEYLKEELKSLGERSFLSYVNSLPEYMKNTLIYAANKQDITQEDFVKFVSDFVTTDSTDISTNEGARNYLKNSAAFKALYETEDEMDEALDAFEDKEKLIEKAEKIKSKEDSDKIKKQEAEIERVKQEQQQRLEAEKKFAAQIEEESKGLQWDKQRVAEAKANINQQFINEKYQQLIKSPRGLLQFVDLLSHVENGTLDSLYQVLEGKKKSKTAEKLLGNIEKDSLSKALSKNTQSSSRPAVDILSITEA